ncbi:MAG: hypothetical protein WBP94_05335 [Rhodomicrobiaceae bacterium]
MCYKRALVGLSGPIKSNSDLYVKIKEDLTPSHLRCIGGSCPAVYSLSDGDLLIVGKRLSNELFQEIAHKVADDEFAIKLGPQFLEGLVGMQKNKK